jgi:hypothetical protein
MPELKLSTPLTLLGVMVEVVRERFKPEAQISPTSPWLWNENLKETQIFIESGWNENLEGRNVRPGVWVDRDQNIYNKVTLGDRDEDPVPWQGGRTEAFYGHGETDIVIDCTSSKRGESMVVGSMVQDFLHMSSNYIMACFGLRDMSPVILGRTVPFAKDDDLWNSPVQFRAYYEIRWATTPIALALNQIAVRLADIRDPEAHFVEIALRRQVTLD